MKQLLLFLFLLVKLQANADEGMWPIHDFHTDDEDNTLCFYSDSTPSLKDAIVSVGEGGTGCFISKTGLIMTNWHVVKSLIAQYDKTGTIFTNGFCCSPNMPELRFDNLYIKILVRSIDVSKEVSQRLAEGLCWSSLVRDICIKYKPMEKGNKQEIKREFFGKSHFLHEYKIIKDIRLVYCPPQSMASYGGDAENWHWPRKSADFAILRAYVNGDGNETKPFTPKKYLKISKAAIEPNEKVYVLGYPRGASYDMIAADAHDEFLLYMIKHAEILGLRMNAINIQITDLSEEERSQWQRTVSALNNERLKILGQVSGFLRYMIPEKLRIREDSCGLILKKTDKDMYKEFCSLENKADSLVLLINHCLVSDIDYRQSIQAIQFINSAGLVKNKRKFSEKTLKQLVDLVFKTSDVSVEKAITKALLHNLRNKHSKFIPTEIKQEVIGVDEYVDNLYRSSVFVEKNKVLDMLFNKCPIKDDPAMRFLDYTDSIYESDTKLQLDSYVGQLNYVREEILAMLHDEGLIKWPGANGSLRVSYGKTGTQCWSTNLNRAICGMWKNYGCRLKENKLKDKQIVNFTTNCHTSSGSSGSPVINEKGELVGLNFDRIIDGLCGDYYYIPSECLNINVSMDYIIKILQSKNDHKTIIKELCL